MRTLNLEFLPGLVPKKGMWGWILKRNISWLLTVKIFKQHFKYFFHLSKWCFNCLLNKFISLCFYFSKLLLIG